MATVDQAELEEHLREQLQFLDASCLAFDQGIHVEAKRLAATIRTLVHDTPKSTSLLNQLGEKDRIEFVDLLPNLPRPNTVPGGPIIAETGGGYATALMNGAEFSWCPTFRLDPPPSPALGFDEWWTTPHMRAQDGERFSRRTFVLITANKDGGAHVDTGTIPAAFRALTKQGSTGWSGPNGNVTQSPAPAAVRHIAEELRRTIRDHCASMLGLLAVAPPDLTPEPEGVAIFTLTFRSDTVA